jgi:hypothetical protein
MQPDDANPAIPPPTSPPSERPAPPALPVNRATGGRANAREWLITLGAALIAGVASGLIGERTYDRFQPPASVAEATDALSLNLTALNAETAKANGRNGALVFGTLGGLLGLGLGMAGGLSRRSVQGAVTGALLGLLLGAVAGALPSFVMMPWQWHHRQDNADSDSVMLPILLHGGLWGVLGAAAGLAFGLGRWGLKPVRLVQGAVGGLVGAVLGAVVHDAIGFAVFPLERTDEAFASSRGARLMAHLCVAVCVAAGAVLVAGANRRPERTATPPTARPA